MKNKILRETAYKGVINKIIIKTILAILLGIIIVIVVSSLGRGKLADFIVEIISKKYEISLMLASRIYWIYIRRYFDYILLGTMLILILLFFRLILSWFTRYFDEIIEGVDKLSKKKKEPIIMSKELNFMAHKLNEVRSELERSAELEREEERRKNELIVYLAHDIKTPLTSIIGYLNLLDESKNINEKQREEYTKISLEKAYRLEKLINEFFEITRYNLKSVPLNKENINIEYMMVQIVDELYPQLERYNKEVKININENLNVDIDSEKMARVFNNILKNAVCYSEDNSCIEISGKYIDKGINISFKSKGEIPKEKLQYVFEKFYRVDNSRQSSTGGAGLGLAIAKDIVLLHSGEIEVECNNNYTIFSIILPKEF